MVNNPSNYVVVRENDKSCSNHLDVENHNSFINELVILKVQKVIVVKDGVDSGPM